MRKLDKLSVVINYDLSVHACLKSLRWSPSLALHRYNCIQYTSATELNYSSKHTLVNAGQLIKQLFQVSRSNLSGKHMFSFISIHYKVCYILHPPQQHGQQCVLLQLYHIIIPIVQRGAPFSPASDFTVCPRSFNSQTQAGVISEKKTDI